MAYTFTVDLQAESTYYTAYSITWQGIIARTLRGSLEVSSSGGTHTFTDRYSDLEVVVKSAGGFVTSISATGPVPSNGSTSNADLFDMVVESGTIATDDLIDAFTFYHESSGEDSTLKSLFLAATYDITTNSVTVSHDFGWVGQALMGGGGDDIFRLDKDGYHYIYATGGEDIYNAPGEYDEITYSSFNGGLVMTKDGSDRLIEKSNGDIDTLSGVESLYGSNGNDNFNVGLGDFSFVMYGGDGNDKLGGSNKSNLLSGDEGNDKLKGKGGDDVLIGGGGNDKLIGGGGDDILFASSGTGYAYETEKDKMKGNGGKDLFVIETPYNSTYVKKGVAIIKDFEDGTDFIGLVGRDFGVYDPSLYNNLTYDELVFKNSKKGAVIEHEGDKIAVLKNVDANDLSRDDFVEMVSFDFAVVLTEDFYGGYFY